MKTKRFQRDNTRRVGLLFSSDETYAKRMEELNAASQNTTRGGLRTNRRGQRNQGQEAPETLAEWLGSGDVRGDQGQQGGGNQIPEFAPAPSDYDPDFDAPAADTDCYADESVGGNDPTWGFVPA